MGFLQKLSSALAATFSYFLIGSIKIYRFLLSPWVGQHCRFFPSCSAFALEAIENHGPAKGGLLVIKRLARCHPWCAGGFDPVPEKIND